MNISKYVVTWLKHSRESNSRYPHHSWRSLVYNSLLFAFQGDGIEFKRGFMKIKDQLSSIIAKAPKTPASTLPVVT